MGEPLTSSYLCVILAWRDSGHPFFLCERPCLLNPHCVWVTRLCARSCGHLPAAAHLPRGLLCPPAEGEQRTGAAVSHAGPALAPKSPFWVCLKALVVSHKRERTGSPDQISPLLFLIGAWLIFNVSLLKHHLFYYSPLQYAAAGPLLHPALDKLTRVLSSFLFF